MGFPALLPDIDPPRLSLPLIVILHLLQSFLSITLGLLGLDDLVSDDPDFLTPVSFPSLSDHILRHGLAAATDEDTAGVVRRTHFRPRPTLARELLLPATTYGNDAERNGVAESCCCTVCLCELRRRDKVRQSRGCQHVFHRRCLDPWVDLGHRTCPLCRTPLVPADAVAAHLGGTCEAVVDRGWYNYSPDDSTAMRSATLDTT